MERFLESNPGLRSRFNKTIVFEDYSEEELLSILQSFYAKFGMGLGREAEYTVKRYLQWLVCHKPDNFANGREMRNLFELTLTNQANRLATRNTISDDELSVIKVDDLPGWVVEPSEAEGR